MDDHIQNACAVRGSLFQAGSLAKPVTVLAAMHLKAEGLIDFDRNIETYLSSYHLPAGRQTSANPVTFRNLLSPVGIKQADFTTPLPASRHPHTARGHQIDGTIIPEGWNNYPEQAAAGLWATATDLAMFLLEIHKGYEGKSNVFTQASIRELLASPINNHAYGFRLIGKGDQVFITHYGGTVGYRAGMTLNLKTGNGAVFLTNSDNGSNLGEAFFSAVSRAYEWPMFREEIVKRLKHPAAVLQSLAGIYLFPEQGWKVSVVYEHDSLTLVFPAGNRLPLEMVPIQGRPREFVHETGVHANFDSEGLDLKIQLFGQTGQRQASAE